MKKYAISLTAFAAFLIAGCAPPANTNTAANTANANSNANKSAAAPTVDFLMSMDKAANEAFAKSDTKWFQDNLSSKFVMYPMGQRMGKDAVIRMIGSNKCDVKSMNFTEPALTKVNDDTYVLTYKGTFDGSCTRDGRTEKLPPEVRAATVVIREGEKWMGAWHGETPVIDPKNPPPPPAPGNNPASNTNANTNSATNSNASNTAAPAAPAPSANTDTLVKLHQAGWEAFKSRDASFFNNNLASSFGFIDPMGGFHASKADAIRLWTETMKCEGITSVNVSDGHATAISPTVEILTIKGTANGTCDGQKNGTLDSTAIYVKDGEAWKLAYMFETPAV